MAIYHASCNMYALSSRHPCDISRAFCFLLAEARSGRGGRCVHSYVSRCVRNGRASMMHSRVLTPAECEIIYQALIFLMDGTPCVVSNQNTGCSLVINVGECDGEL